MNPTRRPGTDCDNWRFSPPLVRHSQGEELLELVFRQHRLAVPLHHELDELAVPETEPSFNVGDFIGGARGAYEVILMGYAKAVKKKKRSSQS